MKKRVLTKNLLNSSKILRITNNATIYKINNGEVLKIFSPLYISMSKIAEIDLERKILDSEKIALSDKIKKPTMAFYDKNNIFIGYSSNMAKGISYNEKEEILTLKERTDLYRYADIFTKLEQIVRESDAVFPDLCTCDNIFIDEKNNIELIDYDGIQVGNQESMQISTTLGDDELYENLKYKKNNLFTKNLDKKSLIMLYFLSTFNVNLNMVGQVIPIIGETINLDMVFNLLGIEDYDFMNKVSKIFNNNIENEYLGSSLYDIADNYNLNVVKEISNGKYIKKLIKK